MTSVSDFDQIQRLLGDKGRLIGSDSGTVLLPRHTGDAPSTSTSHVISHVTYVDEGGHVHAVLLDKVTTADDGPPPTIGQVIEILSDVAIT